MDGQVLFDSIKNADRPSGPNDNRTNSFDTTLSIYISVSPAEFTVGLVLSMGLQQ